jgi:hypothetical protein
MSLERRIEAAAGDRVFSIHRSLENQKLTVNTYWNSQIAADLVERQESIESKLKDREPLCKRSCEAAPTTGRKALDLPAWHCLGEGDGR